MHPCLRQSLYIITITLCGVLAAYPAAGQDVEPVAQPFPLSSVKLLDGPFKEAMGRDVRYLLDLEPDRFLHNFRELAGLEPKAPLYGGWESRQIAGHSLGHYLSALSMYHAQSGDERISERIDYIVGEMAEVQRAYGNGCVGGIPGQDTLWTQIAQGEVEGEPFALNGVWVPWYTLHKLYAGLIDAYVHAGSEDALQVVTGMADWAYETTKNLPEAQWQEMLDTEHGGMNEALANLYALTGEPRYLELSRRFHHRDVLSPLAARTPHLEGLHANTQIPKVIGAVRQYELTGEDSLKTIADVFWDRVVYHHTYAIGGHSEGEHFGPPDTLAPRLTAATTETCNTYNMLKLSKHLFSLSGAARYADSYERALYNHILASQEPERGMVTYFVPLKPGHFKTYSTPDSSFWCCTGSGMENHVRYNESIYFHGDDELYVNLFIPSEVTWEEKGIVLRQQTRFPEENTTRLRFEMERPADVDLRIRHPQWAESVPTVRINGQEVDSHSEPGSYFTLRRTWQPGDEVEVTFPMRLHVEPTPDDPNRVAILYGPIVLAGSLGTEGMPEDGAYAQDHMKYFDVPAPSVPVLAAEAERMEAWLQPVEGQPLTLHRRHRPAPRRDAHPVLRRAPPALLGILGARLPIWPMIRTSHDSYPESVFHSADARLPAVWHRRPAVGSSRHVDGPHPVRQRVAAHRGWTALGGRGGPCCRRVTTAEAAPDSFMHPPKLSLQ